MKPHALLLLLTTLTAATAAAGPRQPRFPDLRPLPRGFLNRRITRENDRRLLRFDTYIENIGKGPLEVRGRRKKTSDPMLAYQALYLDARRRRFRTKQIGEFEWHAEHRHWHLLQVAEYRLKNLAGEPVTTGSKVSFCFVDTSNTSPELPKSPQLQQYLRCSNDVNAKHFKAGISVGWSDIYNLGLFGQWVDITDVPAGDYRLEVEIDPLNLIQESDETNNLIDFPITINTPDE